MEIQVDKVVGLVPVAVITVKGDLDASNYLELIKKAENICRSGVGNILLDLSGTTFVSSSGLVALHSIALLVRGEQPLDASAGWDTFHAMDRHLSNGIQEHIKLLDPQPRVARTLERTGLKDFFHIYTDREQALMSFKFENYQAA
jgi:anti-anti-sigma regulatory factor